MYITFVITVQIRHMTQYKGTLYIPRNAIWSKYLRLQYQSKFAFTK